MLSITEELKAKTMAYWKLSRIWNGRVKVDVETGDAIELCSSILAKTAYTRPLSARADCLMQEIIKGEGRKLPISHVIPFPMKQEVGA